MNRIAVGRSVPELHFAQRRFARNRKAGRCADTSPNFPQPAMLSPEAGERSGRAKRR